MRFKIMAFVAVAAAFVGLSGCETMSVEECTAADWGSLGYQDASSNGADRFAQRAQSCSEKGVAADAGAYRGGFENGMRAFCQPEHGFQFARGGGTFNGSCPGDLAADFSYAYSDGRRVHEAQSAVDEARSRASSAEGRQRSIEDYIRRHERALAAATTNEDKTRLQTEIDQLRRDRRDAIEAYRIAQEQIPRLMRNLDRVRADIGGRYGPW